MNSGEVIEVKWLLYELILKLFLRDSLRVREDILCIHALLQVMHQIDVRNTEVMIWHLLVKLRFQLLILLL